LVLPPKSSLQIEVLPHEHPVELATEERGLVVHAFDVKTTLVQGDKKWVLRGEARGADWPPPPPEYVASLYGAQRAARFPALGKKIGHFGYWDAHVAGMLQCVAKGEWSDKSASYIHADKETLETVKTLRTKKARTPEEREFLDYFDLLEEARILVMWAWRAGHPRRP
jgi:hypothetical protein